MEVMAGRMDRGFMQYQKEFEDKALEVLRSGWYILGKQLSDFEEQFAEYTHTKACAGVGNGLDALMIACRMLGIGPGDEVIVQGNTYIASVMGITMNGATPVFCEPGEDYQIDPSKVEALITPRTKAVMVVHLYGAVTDMDEICRICREHGLMLVEDCAQAHGATWKGKVIGSFGDAGCFSFYPSKNIGAFGDAGAIVSKDEALIRKVKIFRNYGSEKRYYNQMEGTNSRLDEMQAGLLQVRLRHAEEITRERRALASVYTEGIKNPKLILPKVREGCDPVWHQYVVRCKERDALMEYLKGLGIGSIIHYPIPPHLAECYERLGHKRGDYPITEHYADTVLSLPMYNGMTPEEQTYVIDALNRF